MRVDKQELYYIDSENWYIWCAGRLANIFQSKYMKIKLLVWDYLGWLSGGTAKTPAQIKLQPLTYRVVLCSHYVPFSASINLQLSYSQDSLYRISVLAFNKNTKSLESQKLFQNITSLYIYEVGCFSLFPNVKRMKENQSGSCQCSVILCKTPWVQKTNINKSITILVFPYHFYRSSCILAFPNGCFLHRTKFFIPCVG